MYIINVNIIAHRSLPGGNKVVVVAVIGVVSVFIDVGSVVVLGTVVRVSDGTGLGSGGATD